jgi:hypothetical protein
MCGTKYLPDRAPVGGSSLGTIATGQPLQMSCGHDLTFALRAGPCLPPLRWPRAPIADCETTGKGLNNHLPAVLSRILCRHLGAWAR